MQNEMGLILTLYFSHLYVVTSHVVRHKVYI